MTDRTLKELADAEIVPDMGGQNGWFVRFGEKDYDTVNKSGKNTLLLKDDVDVQDTVNYGGIVVNFDLKKDEIFLRDDNDEVRVPEKKHENVMWALYDRDGPRLNKLFDEFYVPEVREGLMDQFMPRFRRNKEEIRKTDGGWVVTGDILVSWDANNHPVNVATTHVVSGGKTVEADKEKQAREINWPPMTGELVATAPDGREFSIDEVEARFLATVGLILDRNPSNYDDTVSKLIESAGIEGFTDTKSGLHHSHSMQKHTLEQLDVTEDAQSRLWYNEYDHAGVWEMAMREDEFRDAPIDVFEDAANNSEKKWNKIQSTKEKAPIPKNVRRDLEYRYS